MGMADVVWEEYQRKLGQVERLEDEVGRWSRKWEGAANQARSWKARVRILASQRDEARQEWKDTANELAALRQSRAQERAQPDHPLEGFRQAVREALGLEADGPGAVAQIRRLKDELAATKEKLDRMDEANDALRHKAALLRAQPAGTSLDAVLEDNERLRGELEGCRRDMRGYQEQAEGYRKTIAELRLTRPSPLDAPSRVAATQAEVTGGRPA